MGLGRAVRADILNSLLGGAPWSPPKTLFLALRTADGEVDGGGYARLPVECSEANWPRVPRDGDADAATRASNARFEFPAASGTWSSGEPIVGWCLYDAPTGGEDVLSGDLKSPKRIAEYDVFYFPAGSILVDMT